MTIKKQYKSSFWLQ